jgi:iron complex transport system substrate-binding protein
MKSPDGIFTVSFLNFPKFLYAHSFSSPNYRFSSRQYQFLEIVYVTQGRIQMILDGTEYYAEKGDCLVIRPGTMADLVSDCSFSRHAHLSVGIECAMESSEGEVPPKDEHSFVFTFRTKSRLALPETFSSLFEELIHAYQQSETNLATGLFLQLCSILSPKEGPSAQHKSSAYTRKIKDYIEHNYQKHITIPFLADYLSITPEYASSVFRRETGETIITYLNRTRIRVAKDLLQNRSISIQYIAEQVGIPDDAYFSRLFKKEEGISPREYRSTLQRAYISY